MISIASQLFRLHLSHDCNPNIISKFRNKETVESHLGVRKSFRRTPRSEKVLAFAMSQLKWEMVKSFVQVNKFHTYLTHETLPAEERVSNFHDHGKTPSYQSFADASMRKVA